MTPTEEPSLRRPIRSPLETVVCRCRLQVRSDNQFCGLVHRRERRATLDGFSTYAPTASITLYAQWRPIIFTVSLNPEGGGVTPSAVSLSAGSPTPLPAPAYAGYKFVGWFTAATGGTLESSPYLVTSSTTLYAQWAPDAYVVTYNATGGHVTPATASTFNVGDRAPLTLATPTRSGYRFDGWYGAASGGPLESSPYTPTASLTLYAKWTPNAPAKPGDVTISRTGNVVNVHWTVVDNASHYVCTLSRGSSSLSVERSTTTANHCSFTRARAPHRLSGECRGDERRGGPRARRWRTSGTARR